MFTISLLSHALSLRSHSLALSLSHSRSHSHSHLTLTLTLTLTSLSLTLTHTLPSTSTHIFSLLFSELYFFVSNKTKEFRQDYLLVPHARGNPACGEQKWTREGEEGEGEEGERERTEESEVESDSLLIFIVDFSQAMLKVILSIVSA
jgi:hypothetical protein